MPSPQIERINSTLPLEENIDLHVKGRVVQQISIVVIFLFVVLAALGLFGEGVLSKKKLQAEGTTIRYEKFTRHGGESKLVFDLFSGDSIKQISIPDTYLAYFQIENIVPEPEKNRLAGNYVVYTFNGEHSRNVTFFLSPIKIGRLKAIVKSNRTDFELSHFIYP